MKGQRIDKILVEREIADSRSKAHAMVMSGVVIAGERRVDKPSETFPPDVSIRIKGQVPESRYASRAGLKLEHALAHFGVDPTGKICLDVGSSTGGFTDCLLTSGARRVVAVDSGTNQMIWRLRNDPRIELREKTNARNLLPGEFAVLFDLAVVDVSFISVTKILPAIYPLLNKSADLIVLIKPQFEVGKGEVGKGGIVHEHEKHERVVSEIVSFAEELGCVTCGVIDSPILGAEGNKEFLAHFQKQQQSERTAVSGELVEGTDFYFEDGLMVLNEGFLAKRGFCCGSKCRHCPFGHINVPDHSR